MRARSEWFTNEVRHDQVESSAIGPYRFSTTDGVEHSVFVFNDTIKETYVRVARQLLDEDASPDARREAREIYHDDPRGGGAVEYRKIMSRFENRG